MGLYSLSIVPSARRELRALPSHQIARLHAKMVTLSTEPRPWSSQKLSGSDNTYRLRQGDYRVVYQIDDAARQVTVLRIRHRKDAYR